MGQNASRLFSSSSLFFFNDTATTEIYPLSLHDALPICAWRRRPGGTPAHAQPGAGHRFDSGLGGHVHPGAVDTGIDSNPAMASCVCSVGFTCPAHASAGDGAAGGAVRSGSDIIRANLGP